MTGLELTLRRDATVKKTTLGRLYVGRAFECYTLEDVVRELPGVPVEVWKIPKETAIPMGRYRLGLVNSPTFGPNTLTLLSVPGFTHIRIHAGNDDAETEGCILVGRGVIHDPEGDGGNLTESRLALKALKDLLVPILRVGDEVHLTVVRV